MSSRVFSRRNYHPDGVYWPADGHGHASRECVNGAQPWSKTAEAVCLAYSQANERIAPSGQFPEGRVDSAVCSNGPIRPVYRWKESTSPPSLQGAVSPSDRRAFVSGRCTLHNFIFVCDSTKTSLCAGLAGRRGRTVLAWPGVAESLAKQASLALRGHHCKHGFYLFNCSLAQL